MRIIVLIILTNILFSSCSNRNEKIQVIDTKADIISPTKLSEVFIKTNQISLESTTPLINRIIRVIKTKDNIFILDIAVGGSRILQFDCQGQYIKLIGSVGHGPGQYFTIADFAIDTNNNKVFVASLYQILCYDFDGRFIRSGPTNVGENWNSCVNFMTFVEGQLWSFEDKTIPANKKSYKWKYKGDLIRYNEQLKVVDTTTILEAYLKLDFFGGFSGYFLSNLQEKMFVYFPILQSEPFLRDTLFEFRDFKKIPVLKFDFADILSVNENINLNNNPTPQDLLDASLKIRNIKIENICRTDRFVFVNYSNNKFESFLFCYDLDKQKGYNMSDGFTDDLFGTGKTISLIPLDLRNGEFCFIKDGYEAEGIVDGVGENSNPVIFFVKTKEEQ